MNNKYFLLRHGQTIYNKSGIMYPFPENPPVEITKEGEEMIKKAAKSLKDKKIDLIFSSDLFRAKQSSKIVSDEIGVKPKFDKRLIDTNYGVYMGKPKEDFEKEFFTPEKRFYERPEKGESQKDCKERMESFLKEIEKKYKNKNILIVSHGDPIMLIKGIIKGLKTDQEFLKFLSEEKMPEVGELRMINNF